MTATRREVLAGLAAAAAQPAPGALEDPTPDAAVAALLASPPADDRLGPWRLIDESQEAADRRRIAPAELLARLRALEPLALSPSARLDLDVVTVHTALEARSGREFPFGAGPGRPYVLDPRTGTHRLVAAGLGGPAPGAASAADHAAALDLLVRNVDGETERLRADAAGWNVTPPRVLLAATATAVRAAAAMDPVASPLARRAPDPAAAAARLESRLRPALARQVEALDALRDRSAEGGGAARFRNGEAYHALCLRLGTGTDLTPAQAEAQAREAIARLTAELDGRLRAEGLTRGGVGERLRTLMAEPSGLYPDDDAGRDRAVAEMNAVLADALRRTPALVADLPPGPIAVRRMRRADERAARAGYREATPTGGAYYVDLHDIRKRPAWTLPTVVWHETAPGHLVQLPIQTRVKPPALRVRASPGYFEGWAVYCETLGAELDAYDGRARIGHLQSLLFRLSRAVADAGVHRHGWTPARTQAELAAIYGDGLFNSLQTEAERVVTAPGGGGADAFGWLEIARLRRGWRGDPRAFHHAVLARGPYPPRHLQRALSLG